MRNVALPRTGLNTLAKPTVLVKQSKAVERSVDLLDRSPVFAIANRRPVAKQTQPRLSIRYQNPYSAQSRIARSTSEESMAILPIQVPNADRPWNAPSDWSARG